MYEQILLSPWFSLTLGWLVSVALPISIYSGWVGGETFFNSGQKSATVVTTIAFLISHSAVRRLRATYPGGRSGYFIAPQVIAIFVFLSLIALLLRIDISRLILVSCGFMALLWFHCEYLATFKYRRLKIALIPGGEADQLRSLPDIDAREIENEELGGKRFDAVVADFEALDDDTERFLTQCALNRIAVYDARAVYESVTGRVRINRMSENSIGSLLPGPMYERVKLIMDLLIVFLSLPIVLPICLATAMLIKMESPGPVIFKQARIGRGNREFVIYKFRSMRVDDKCHPQFAGENDPRITKVGRLIRKLRIDELPQFMNILKGDMSLVGPRPEQPLFVEEFNRKIPFYSYRHVVKPGITGWAQVRHGYAANADETQIKIEHDFYYIKHCSLYLDMLVLLLTIKTMLTGFGAR
ncbi:exopolysaccharide biosynthesis polyprenyl glycosylphosphotransferase [Allopusillimonas soli]|uniref:Exopolysaccharide biosynthesis polyprenyl glycosylphosphotransferase n=1 Tax=Allopusillimonas soli TaxID=659016 RepID=A0A853FGV2_9BURK|nr:exopolysaccharide biosynthesis polyprenyl glycosylphosphotransferase [Allopusillimonas soli]NYT38020.1 exopolysaccharide biosynthesis polyprenyl glycosylphosphotransferase [Allopusillimonas soli]